MSSTQVIAALHSQNNFPPAMLKNPNLIETLDTNLFIAELKNGMANTLQVIH